MSHQTTGHLDSSEGIQAELLQAHTAGEQILHNSSGNHYASVALSENSSAQLGDVHHHYIVNIPARLLPAVGINNQDITRKSVIREEQVLSTSRLCGTNVSQQSS